MTANDPVERSWDLSLYELHRTPQEAITDDTEIAVSARSLQSELTCPICLDMLTNTMTTKECLHRYSSGFMIKPQKLTKSPSRFDVYLLSEFQINREISLNFCGLPICLEMLTYRVSHIEV